MADETTTDYDGSTQLRHVVNSYMFQTNPSFTTNNIIDSPSETQIYDAGSNKVADTVYGYDACCLQGSGVNLQKESSLNLGNQTPVQRWLNTDGSTITTTNKYWDTGEVYQHLDPRLHATQYAYDATGAFANQITYPTTTKPDGTQAQHVETFVHDGNTGLVVTHTDQNSLQTRYTYDTLRRTTEIDYPDSSWERFSYNDTTPTPSVTVTREIDSSGKTFTGVGTVDGLGRIIKTQTSDPDCSTGYISNDTTYDDLGRKYTFSNPYCSTSDPTYGVTTYQYDALSRPKQTTYADGNSEALSYSGSAVKHTEASNGSYNSQHVLQDDALGRLTAVCEVASTVQQGGGNTQPSACTLKIAATGFLTSYTYDTLGNLTKVSQTGLNDRTFSYDSLSRLKCSVNPEVSAGAVATPCTSGSGSGQTTYNYNSDSLVSTKKSPAPNQTSPLVYVTVAYSYDNLDRLIAKTYSDSTQPASFGYDEARAWGLSPPTNYPIGHMTSQWIGSQSGVEAGQSYASYVAYDKAGHTVEDYQYVADASLWNTHLYGRDYFGNLTSFDNGQQLNGHEIVITYNYNTALHMTSAMSSLNDSSHPQNLLSAITYGAFGPKSSQWGNTVTENQDYTIRGWLNSRTHQAQRSGTPGSGTVSIGGTEQTKQQVTPAKSGTGYVDVSSSFGGDQSKQVTTHQATPGTGTVTITGVEGTLCVAWNQHNQCITWLNDQGNVSIVINGHTSTAHYGGGSTASSLASGIASAMNGDSGAPAAAVANGAVLTITSKASGSNTNYSLSASWQSLDPDDFGSGSFQAHPSGSTLTGGTDAIYATVYDSGTMTITVNGHPTSANWGQGDSTSSVASKMVSAIQGDGGAAVTASLSGSRVNLTSKATGQASNYPCLLRPRITLATSPRRRLHQRLPEER